MSIMQSPSEKNIQLSSRRRTPIEGEIDESPPQARRLRVAALPALVARDGVQLLGIDVPPTPVALAEKVLGVVELRSLPTSEASALPGLVADAVIERLRVAGAITAPATATAEPERILISSDEAAALLGITRRALAKRVERHQVPGVVRTGRRIEFNRAKLIAGLDRRTRA